MEDPQRAQRLWLAIAVTTLWLLRVGGSAEEEAKARQAEAMVVGQCESCRQLRRMTSVFAQGHRSILMAMLKHQRLPLGHWLPQPWPALPLT